MRVRPAAQRERRHPLADPLAQQVGVLYAARRPGARVPAQHRERVESIRRRSGGVHQAIVECVLGGEERHELRGALVARHVRRQVAEILLLGLTDGVVGQEHDRVAAREPADRMVHIDPHVHALGGRQPALGRPELHRDERAVLPEPLEHGALSETARRRHRVGATYTAS